MYPSLPSWTNYFFLKPFIFSVAECWIFRNVSICVIADVLRDFFKKMLELNVVGFVAFLFLKDFIKRVLFAGSGDQCLGYEAYYSF